MVDLAATMFAVAVHKCFVFLFANANELLLNRNICSSRRRVEISHSSWFCFNKAELFGDLLHGCAINTACPFVSVYNYRKQAAAQLPTKNVYDCCAAK